MNSIDKDLVFIDTNVLVYAIDGRDREKRDQARLLLESLQAAGTFMISTQVLMEFYNALTRKLAIDQLKAKALVEGFSKIPLITVDKDIIRQAIDISILAQISFWDAQIIAAAERGNCTRIISEDLNDGQIINGIQIVNPFLP